MTGLADLPDELLLYVITNIGSDPQTLSVVQLVCRRLFKVARDGEVWRTLCFHSSIAGRRHNQATIPKTIPPRSMQALQAEAATVTSGTRMESSQRSAQGPSQTRKRSQAAELTGWDPRYPQEDVNWYREYIARQADIDVRWATLAKPNDRDIEGVALCKDSSGTQRAIVRIGDGRVGTWSLDTETAAEAPREVFQTGRPILKSGYGQPYEGMVEDQASMADSASTDCISVDRAHHKAHIAVDCQLNEVDLNTMQLVSHTALPRPISALSNSSPGAPLIVGTSSGLYRHDPRLSSRWFDGSQIIQHQLSSKQPHFAPGPHLPLSILQVGMSSYESTPADIYAAGRYPSILVYDQRTFPTVRESIWSGANLSSLSMIPGVVPYIPPEINLFGGMSQTEHPRPSSGRTIIGCGAKNGKGSLELYGVDCTTGGVYGSIKNRTMASRVKLLSVVSHGERICTSDADGSIKWFERDGFSLVRQINTNDLQTEVKTPSQNRTGLFGMRQDNGDVVQKLLPLSNKENAGILIWAGDRIGLLNFGQSSRSKSNQDLVDDELTKARAYEGDMRRLLEAQAMETRRMQNLGME